MKITKHKLPKPLKKELIAFFENHPPAQFGTCLRSMLLDYLRHEIEIGAPTYMHRFLWSVNDFLDLLDTAQKTTAHWHCTEAGDEF